MESFRTVIQPTIEDWDIDHHDALLMMGSCFTDNIGEKLKVDAFDVEFNLFGTIFNPASILRLIERAVLDEFFTDVEFFEMNGVFQHFDLNHTMANTDLSAAVDLANASLMALKKRMLSANYFIFTYGTAWVYKYKETGKTVANCHKLPREQFNKTLLDLKSLEGIILQTKQFIESVNPKAKFIFTVSPVRHWKDGVTQNSCSKSLLRIALENILVDNTKYFPAYEIMMDDLRDYRFYKRDMLHPNNQAVDYIYDFFGKCFFREKTVTLNEEIRSLKSAQNHRPLNASSVAHQRFQSNTTEELKSLWKAHPFLEKRW